MHIHEMTAPCWSTSSFGDAVDTSPTELSVLGAHLASCTLSRGRLFAFRVAEAMNGFVTGRFVTTLLVMALLIGAGSLML